MAAERAATFLREAGFAFDDPALISRTAWDAMEQAAILAKRTTGIEPDYGEVAREALVGVGMPMTVEEARQLLEAIYVSGPEGGKIAYPDAASTLVELKRRGFLLGMATNRSFGGERFREDLRSAGLDIGWAASAVSVEVGFIKPHPGLFEAALEALGTPPGETLMVGNSLAEDIAGSQALGMLAAWKRSKPDAEGVVPDFEFDEVRELLNIPLLQAAP